MELDFASMDTLAYTDIDARISMQSESSFEKKNLVCLILIILVEILGHEFQFNVKSIWVSFKHFLHWIEHKVKKIKIINFFCVLKH